MPSSDAGCAYNDTCMHSDTVVIFSILPWACTQFSKQMCITVSSHLTYNNMVYDQLLYWSVEETYGQKYIVWGLIVWL